MADTVRFQGERPRDFGQPEVRSSGHGLLQSLRHMATATVSNEIQRFTVIRNLQKFREATDAHTHTHAHTHTYAPHARAQWLRCCSTWTLELRMVMGAERGTTLKNDLRAEAEWQPATRGLP
jgi:hypothetical protein